MADQERKPLDIENLELGELEAEELEDVSGGDLTTGIGFSEKPNTGCGPNDGCNIPC